MRDQIKEQKSETIVEEQEFMFGTKDDGGMKAKATINDGRVLCTSFILYSKDLSRPAQVFNLTEKAQRDFIAYVLDRVKEA